MVNVKQGIQAVALTLCLTQKEFVWLLWFFYFSNEDKPLTLLTLGQTLCPNNIIFSKNLKIPQSKIFRHGIDSLIHFIKLFSWFVQNESAVKSSRDAYKIFSFCLVFLLISDRTRIWLSLMALLKLFLNGKQSFSFVICLIC